MKTLHTIIGMLAALYICTACQKLLQTEFAEQSDSQTATQLGVVTGTSTQNPARKITDFKIDSGVSDAPADGVLWGYTESAYCKRESNPLRQTLAVYVNNVLQAFNWFFDLDRSSSFAVGIPGGAKMDADRKCNSSAASSAAGFFSLGTTGNEAPIDVPFDEPVYATYTSIVTASIWVGSAVELNELKGHVSEDGDFSESTIVIRSGVRKQRDKSGNLVDEGKIAANITIVVPEGQWFKIEAKHRALDTYESAKLMAYPGLQVGSYEPMDFNQRNTVDYDGFVLASADMGNCKIGSKFANQELVGNVGVKNGNPRIKSTALRTIIKRKDYGPNRLGFLFPMLAGDFSVSLTCTGTNETLYYVPILD